MSKITGIRNILYRGFSLLSKKCFPLVTDLADSYTIRPEVHLGLVPFLTITNS